MEPVTYEALLPRVVKLYQREPTGGPLHLVLDDGNVRDTDVMFCADQAQKAGDDEAFELATDLLGASQRTRLRLHHVPKLVDVGRVTRSADESREDRPSSCDHCQEQVNALEGLADRLEDIEHRMHDAIEHSTMPRYMVGEPFTSHACDIFEEGEYICQATTREKALDIVARLEQSWNAQ